MIPYLTEWLRSLSSQLEALRVFDYLSSRSILAALTAFLVSVLFGRRMIVWLFTKRFRDVSEETLLADASSKRGTPTMGGLMLVAATSVGFLSWARLDNRFGWMGFAALLYFGMVGLLDDYKKVRAGGSLGGLSRGSKYGLEIGFALIFTLFYLHPDLTPFPEGFAGQLFVPLFKYPVANIGWWYAGLAIFMILMVTNGVNFTDGLDGLAIVPSIATAAVYGIFAYIIGNSIQSAYLQFEYIPGTEELAVLCAALAGGGLGFLWFNAYPAEVFMGDTGSLAIGGVLASVSLLLKQELLFFIVGGVFVFELASSAIQMYIGEPLAGRRLLYRAPVHLSFRHLGIAEPRVVVRFWILSVMLALLGLFTIKLR